MKLCEKCDGIIPQGGETLCTSSGWCACPENGLIKASQLTSKE